MKMPLFAESEVERRWLLLRDRYRRAKKAAVTVAPSGSGREQTERRRTRWALFDVMDAFMAKHTNLRRQ